MALILRNLRYFSLIVAFLSCTSLGAQDITVSAKKDLVDLNENDAYYLKDKFGQGDGMTMTDPYFVVDREVIVSLAYNRSLHSDIEGTAPWALRIQYELVEYPMEKDIEDAGELILVFDDVEGVYQASEKYDLPGYAALLRITHIDHSTNYSNDPSTATWQSGQGPVPDDVHVEISIKTEEYRKISTQSVIASTDIAHSYDGSNNEATIYWKYLKGAEEYELEWAYWDAENINQSPEPEEIFKKAARIELTDNYFTFPVTYPKGKLYYRARGVGRFIGGDVGKNYSHRRYSSWSVQKEIVLNNEFNIQNATNREMHWQASTVFAEGGKYKKVITYADDGLRTRQVQTNLSTEKTTIVSTQHYDVEGRSVLQVLPAPAVEAGGYNNDLFFKPNFNLGFEYDAFDKEKPDAMATSVAGSSQYYSSNNTSGGLYNSWIPSAGGFPYSQMRYLNDGTGRVRAQTGLGQNYQLGSGRETEYFYDDATSTQLHRLFGSNVGEAKYYKRNVVKDPNGQFSIAYVDPAGRTIATALAGESPDNVIELDSELGGTQLLVENLMDNNVYDDEGCTSITQTKLMNVKETDYTFHYNLLDAVADLPSVSMCMECKYELSFEIYDPCGVPVVDAMNGQNVVAFTGNDLCNTSSTPETFAVNFSLTFCEIGTYNIIKKLKVIKPSLLELTEIAETMIDYDVFRDTELATMDMSLCIETCDEYCVFTVDAEQPNLSAIDRQIAIDACLASTCVLDETFLDTTLINAMEAQCDAIYVLMEEQVGIGGCLEGTLIDQHPDYCHWMQCQALEGTRRYDYELANCTDLACLNALLSLNLSSYSAFNKAATDALRINDSDFPSVHQGLLTTEVNNYAPDINGNLLHLYDHVTGLVTELTNQGFTVSDERKVSMIIGMYIGAKQRAIQKMKVAEGCEPNETDCQAYAGDGPNFTEYDDQDDALLYAESNGWDETLDDCQVKARSWYESLLDRLDGCALTATEEADVLEIFYGYCLSNTDLDNPMGFLIDGTPEYNNAGGTGQSLAQLIENAVTSCSNIDISVVIDEIAIPIDSVYCVLYELDATGQPTTTVQTATHYNTTCMLYLLDYVDKLPLQPNDNLDYTYSMPNPFDLCFTEVKLITDGNIYGNISLVHKKLISIDGNGCCYEIVEMDDDGNQILAAIDLGTMLNVRDVKFSLVGGALVANFTAELNINDIISTNENLWLIKSTSSVCPSGGGGSSIATGRDPGGSSVSTTCFQETGPVYVYCETIPVYPDECEDILVSVIYENIIREKYNEVIDEKITTIINEYNCLSNPQENFWVEYQSTEHHYTLYYYDQAGNLIQTVPPVGVEPFSLNDATKFDNEGRWVGGKTQPNHFQKTNYWYNSLGQVTESRTPDAGVSEFKYDFAQRLRASRNAKQNDDATYSYTKFDAIGRTIEVGEVNNSGGATSFDGIQAYDLNNQIWPINGLLSEVTETYYDETSLGRKNMRNRVSRMVRKADKAGTATIETLYSYDVHGNVTNLVHKIPDLGDTNFATEFDVAYDYDLISGKVNELRYQAGKPDQYYHKYEYDADNRLTNVWTSLDEVHWEEDARYFYYLHGPMARMEVGHDKVQGSDYYYTIQGWIRGVNAPLAAHDAPAYTSGGMYDLGLDGNTNTGHHNNRYLGLDASAYNLFYYQGDYMALDNSKVDFKSRATLPSEVLQRSPDGCNPIFGHHRGLFNGNISMMMTDLRGDASNSPGMNYMAYQYDALHRIKEGKSFDIQNDALNVNGIYNTSYVYDPNGNLESLKRNSTGLIDDIQYSYSSNQGRRENNLLNSVVDLSGNSMGLGSTQNYQYDAIGNLIANPDDQVTNIEWSVYGKVEKVEKTNGIVTYLYDAGDQRLRERNELDGKDTWYIRDPQGNLLGLYQKQITEEVTELRQKEVPLYGSSRLGMYKFQLGREVEIGQPANERLSGMVYSRYRGQKYFECSNHLGNVLTVVTDQLRGIEVGSPIQMPGGMTMFDTRYEADVVSYSDYYPFGLAMPDRNGNSAEYRYGFNGKEKDEEGEFGSSTHYDYGFRIYNPEVGRFLSVDPLTKQNLSYTPFQYGANSPIAYLDDGGDNILYIVFVKGANPLLEESHKSAIVARAQSIYTDQNINVKVVALEVDRAFTEQERQFFDNTDRITYIAQKKDVLHKIEPERSSNFLTEGFTYGDNTGFYTYDNFVENDHIPNTDNLTFSDISQNEQDIIGPLEVDLVSWIARGAIHESGGHGVISNRAKHDTPMGNDFDRPTNIMQHAKYTPFYKLPYQQEPELFEFTVDHLEELRTYYNRYESDGFSPPSRIVPADNFSNRPLVYKNN